MRQVANTPEPIRRYHREPIPNEGALSQIKIADEGEFYLQKNGMASVSDDIRK